MTIRGHSDNLIPNITKKMEIHQFTANDSYTSDAFIINFYGHLEHMASRQKEKEVFSSRITLDL